MDVTTRSLELFDRPDHWGRIDEDVPIFVPHVTKDRDGKVVKVDAKRLQKIADEINRNFEENGCPVKFYDGHTKDPKKFPQEDQPAILAYGVGAYVGKWGPRDKVGLLVKKLYCRKDSVLKYVARPERSAEFYPDADEIRGVALLKTDPRLDMGFTIYARSDGVLCYQRGVERMPDPTTMPPDKNDPDPSEITPPGEDEPISDEEKQKFMRYMKACFPKLASMESTSPEGAEPPPPVMDRPGAEKMGRDLNAMHYARIKKEVAEQVNQFKAEATKEIEALKTERQMVIYERDLNNLQNDGYMLDVSEELADCRSMSADQFKKHKEKIVRRYERDVTKRPLIDTMWSDKNPTGSPDVISEDHMVAALKYQRDHGDTDDWETCLEKTHGTRAGVAR